MITKSVKLWLGSGPRVVIPVSQFDTMWAFTFTIINGSTEWTIPTGANVVMNGLKPDGNVFAFAGMVSNNTVTVDCDVQMTAVAGETECELSILADGVTVGTCNFILLVEEAPKSPLDVSSKSTLPAYADLLEMFSGDISTAVDAWLNAHSSQIGGLTDGAKQALLTLLEHVAYTDDQGQTYLDALEAELYPPAELDYITATFYQGTAVIYTSDNLDVLRQYLTVVATYTDTTTETVTTYTLTGTLTAGTSTITVSYGGKTDTFTVTVTKSWDSVWTYTDGLPTVDEWVDSGTGTATDVSTGLKLLNKTYSKSTEITNGTVEAHLQIVNERTTMSGVKAALRIGDTTNSVYILFHLTSSQARNITLQQNTTASRGTVIGSWDFGGEYTVKITLNNGVGTVEVNDVVLINNFDATTTYDKGPLLFGNINTYGSSIWQYVKYMSNE